MATTASGYLKGDENGNAYPLSRVTESAQPAGACVKVNFDLRMQARLYGGAVKSALQASAYSGYGGREEIMKYALLRHRRRW